VGFEQVIEHWIGGQLIRLVIDRIDRLPGGESLIIDYKTGSVKPQKWFGERPEEPQLPLYAVSAGEPPAAVVYAVIRNDGCQYLGLVNAPGLFPGLPQEGKRYEYLAEAGRDLPGTTAEWKVTLHRLMAEFLAGEAAVAPLKGRRSCDAAWCELQPLCRIDELEQLQDPGGAR
jgi:RecB family exonuclease